MAIALNATKIKLVFLGILFFSNIRRFFPILNASIRWNTDFLSAFNLGTVNRIKWLLSGCFNVKNKQLLL